MTVNSLSFLLFLAGLFILYYILCPRRLRWTALLAASVLFYVLASAASPVYMLATSVCIWIAGLAMEELNARERGRRAEKTATPEFLRASRTRKRWVLAGAAAQPDRRLTIAQKCRTSQPADRPASDLNVWGYRSLRAR